MTDRTDTYIFDGNTSRRGYRMNKMFMSLRTASARERFQATRRRTATRSG